MSAPASSRRLTHLLPLVASQVVGVACGLAGVRLSSSLLTPEVLGVFGLLLSTQRLSVFVTHQGLVQHVQRYWTAQRPAPAYVGHLLRAARWPTLWLSLGLVVVALILHQTADLPLSPWWWMWMLVINLLTTLAHLLHAALQAEERYWAHFWMSAVGSVTRTFLPLGLAVVAGAALPQLGLGFLGHAVLWSAAGLFTLRAAWRRPAPAGAAAAESTERSPHDLVQAFAVAGLAGWLTGAAVRWLAATTLGAEATGYFVLASNLTAVIPAGLSLVAVSYTFPPLFAAARAGQTPDQLLAMSTRWALIVLGLGQLGIIALTFGGPWLIGTLIDYRYADAMGWMAATGGAALAAISMPFFSNLLLAWNREKDCVGLAVLSASFRLLVMAVLAASGSTPAFAWGLALLTWPTLALEYAFVRARRPLH